MGRVAVIGSEPLVQGFALAGALVVPAETPAEVRRAWAGLADDVVLVLLTAPAARVLGDGVAARLTAVMPE